MTGFKNFILGTDDNAEYDVTLTVTDDDGGSFQQTKTVVVVNVAPLARMEAALLTVKNTYNK